MTENVTIGSKVRDRVTGYSGIVIGYHKWISGCDTVTVQSQEMKDGEPVGERAFDIIRVEFLSPPEFVLDPRENKTGGPEKKVSKPNGL